MRLRSLGFRVLMGGPVGTLHRVVGNSEAGRRTEALKEREGEKDSQ